MEKYGKSFSLPVDATLNQNQSKLRILIFLIALQMLSNRHSLLDQHVQVLRNSWSKTRLLQDTQNLVSRDALYLSDTIRVTKDNTNLIDNT